MEHSEIIRARGQKKSSLTKLKLYLESKDNFDLADLSVRLERLEIVFEEFSKLDVLLPVEQSEFSEIEDVYLEIKILIRSKIEVITSLSEVQQNSNAVVLSADVNNRIETIKLPKITIPIFTGNYLDWLNFKDMFKSTVHDNVSLSKVHKFQYLKGLLSGDAADLIKHLPVSENSYDEAWQKIEKRYDNKKHISTALLNTFLDQNKINEPSGIKLRRLADVSDEVIRGLKALDEKANLRDLWLIHILLDKVDSETRKLWAQETTDVEFPTLECFVEFLNNRCSYLDVSTSHDIVKTKLSNNVTNVKSNNIVKCVKCSGTHSISKCYKYKAMPLSARKEFIRKNALCFRCLKGHRIKNCLSKSVCEICNKSSHHSSLHEFVYDSNTTSIKDDFSDPVKENVNSHVLLNTASGKFFGLLPTAIVSVNDSAGTKTDCTILLDSGSQCSFISEACVQKLNLKRKNARYCVSGISNSTAGTTKGIVKLQISSKCDTECKLNLNALILNSVTSKLPSFNININEIDYLKSIYLADPTFSKPKVIDIIIGADHFFTVLRAGQITFSKSSLVAQNTIFGWVLSGKLPLHNSENAELLGIHANINIDETLKLFWETEELPKSKVEILNEEELFCENHFQDSYKIHSNGRFSLKLPFFHSNVDWGNSKVGALSRLQSMEKRFKRDSDLKDKYRTFMREYENLNHMTVSEKKSISEINDKYFLPHHAVLKPSSCSTKLRVVFDGSCKASNGISLNDALGAGAKQQPDLFLILLNFRLHPIAFCADIEKMYRQILISPPDQNYQCILWRYNENDPVQEYKLQTVTYGLKCASFLATRCLKQIALDAREVYPEEADIIQNSFYMDDLLSGSTDLSHAIAIAKKISKLLADRGFHLRKWQSNSSEFLSNLSISPLEESVLEILPDTCSKTLGLLWNSTQDTFIFRVNFKFNESITKRTFLSESAKLFDPLGFLSPCSVSIKIFYQQLWTLKLDWDTPFPDKLQEKWKIFLKEFESLSVIQVPRWIHNNEKQISLHGFSDASESAYAAVIYAVQPVSEVESKVTLLVAKSKVAPLKAVSIPRLELNGALLLARLFTAVSQALTKLQITFHAWTDSQVVLSWLSSPPRNWKPFVANRTSEIQELVPSAKWRHVSSKDNSADIASRGISPKALPDCDLWWHGPKWLSMSSKHWPAEIPVTDFSSDSKVSCEKKKNSLFVANIVNVVHDNVIDLLFEKYSNLTKIVSILAFCFRFIDHCRKIVINSGKTTFPKGKISPINFTERNKALNGIISYVQGIHFVEEFKCLKVNKDLPTKSKLKNIHPFIDKDGLLRVGGRLKNSPLPFNAKHPLILPDQHKISSYLIKQFHINYLHANLTLLLNILRQNYWIVNARKLAKSYIHKCIVCNRYRLTSTNQLMGDLPRQRVTPNRPFLICGTDFAGPINMLKFRGRGAKSIKGYIALFICFSTKAIHLECVSDLTSESFIAALKRFSCRRGSPRHIHCDNATNFCGAKRKLNELFKFVSCINRDESICYFLSQQSIQWHMIPPASPHFGGLWESGIKSVKFHLKRVIGDHKLTFEELATLLCQIEAVLNSRPLSPTNDELDNLEVLTPSHFLIGEIITSPPEPADPQNLSLRSRWDLIQKMKIKFWQRWHKDYLSSLQNRSKWNAIKSNLKVGDIVLIKEDNVPPSCWPLGRVIEVHSGSDGAVRVVTIKTVKGYFKRPIVKLSPLPVCQE